MILEVATGTALVLLTWTVVILATTGTGLAAACLTSRGSRDLDVLRSAIWWGLAVLVLLVLALSLVGGLGGALAAWALTTCVLALSAVGVLLLHRLRRRARSRQAWLRPSWLVGLMLVALAAATVYLAFKALAPATNFDTGLYHLGAIHYAYEYGVVPGLANLHAPFGYSNAQFPLAAVLGNGPWGLDGWRLLNGLLFTLVMVDVTIRLLSRPRAWGTYALLVGAAASAIPMVAMADAMVTSPTSDTAVLLLTLVSSAYLCDAVVQRRGAGLALSVSFLTALMTTAMRPTMLVYVAAVVAVATVILWRRGSSTRVTATGWALLALVTLCIAGLQVARDRLLSGWLMYPLSVHDWQVPWLAPDPTSLRDATLANARDPYAPDLYEVAHSWSWIGPWIRRLPSQWEPWFLTAGVIALVIVAVWARQQAGFPRHPRALLLAMSPSAVSIVFWFLASPPSFRFVWGPAIVVLAVPIAAAACALAGTGREPVGVLVPLALAVLGVTAFSMAFRSQGDQINAAREWRLGPVMFRYAVAPPPDVATVEVPMVSGLVLQTPATGSKCWARYPLCSYSMGDRVALLGDDLADGFQTLR